LRRLALASLALLASGPTAGASLACGLDSVEVEAGVVASRWRESGDDGQLLLRESGTLPAVAAAAQSHCAGLQWRLQWRGVAGERTYSGMSTTGAPLVTHSSITERGVELQGLWPLTGGAANGSLAVGASLGWRAIDRRLHGAGVVRGYDERFEDFPVGADLRWQTKSPLQAQVELQLGTALGGRMRLALPNADVAWLDLAQPWFLRARASAGGAAAGGHWRLGVQLRTEAMNAGPSRALYRNGVPVAAASQPRMTQQSAMLFANWTRTLP
jgi:hypothetical protein